MTVSWFDWWEHADLVVRGVFLVLILLSVASWTVILFKSWQFSWVWRWERRAELQVLEDGLAGSALPAGLPSARLLAHAASELHRPHFHREAVATRLQRLAQEERLELENGLTLLATIGSAAPFIGLFGTVWGIMHALQGLGSGSAPSLDLVAGPVAEALVATAVGLFAAIPAVFGYNTLVRRLRRIAGVTEAVALLILDALDESYQKRV